MRLLLSLPLKTLLLGLFCLAAAPAAAQQALAREVYAVRYGTLLSYPAHEFIPGADTTARLDAAMMVWLIRGGDDRVVLVDAGFYREEFVSNNKLAGYRNSAAALAEFNVPASDVTDIIVSHIHWDHLDGVDLYPNARIWIQRAEYEYYVGPNGEKLKPGISAVDAKMLAQLRAAGRVNFIEGDNQEIISGIRVYTGGKHTYESQYVAVESRSGTVIIASDNLYLYENLDRHIPIGTTLDATANLAAQDRMIRLAGSRTLVVPGHDPAVMERFPLIQKDIVRID